jgi:hypothetical protein
MKPSHVIAAAVALIAMLTGSVLSADPRRDAILAEFLAQAKKDEAGFTRFVAERGAAFYRTTHPGGKQGSCTSCHGNSPLDQGKTRAGKDIDPMAVSKSPARYTDRATVEKWFTRNCQDVLGRACTAKEKGDFITYMMGQ